jgi:hypothetical protein
MHQAALAVDVDPDRLSFTRSLRIVRRQVTTGQAAFPPEPPARTLARVTGEIAEHLLPIRRLRAFPRVVKRKMSSFGVKRTKHRTWPRPDPPPADAIVIVGASKPTPIRRPAGPHRPAPATTQTTPSQPNQPKLSALPLASPSQLHLGGGGAAVVVGHAGRCRCLPARFRGPAVVAAVSMDHSMAGNAGIGSRTAVRRRQTTAGRGRRGNRQAFSQVSPVWWAWLDLNQRPHPYQRSTAERCAIPHPRRSRRSVNATRMG